MFAKGSKLRMPSVNVHVGTVSLPVLYTSQQFQPHHSPCWHPLSSLDPICGALLLPALRAHRVHPSTVLKVTVARVRLAEIKVPSLGSLHDAYLNRENVMNLLRGCELLTARLLFDRYRTGPARMGWTGCRSMESTHCENM